MSVEVFAAKEEGGINIIRMPMIVDHTNLSDFELAQEAWLQSSCLVHVFNLAEVFAIMPSTHKAFAQFHKNLRAQDKSLFSINASSNLLPKLKQDGLFSIFNPVENEDVVQRILEMKTAKREENRSRLMADLINSLTSSIDQVFQSDIGLDCLSESPQLKSIGETYPFQVGLQTDISLESFDFSVVIQFQFRVFENIFEYYVARDPQVSETHISLANQEELKKHIKKILSPIFSQLKNSLSEKKRSFFKHGNLQILAGEQLRIHQSITAISVEFQTAVGNFKLEVGILK